MSDLPSRIRYDIDPRQSVIWWGRRSGLEVVEEISISAWRAAVIACVAVWVNEATNISASSSLYWVGVIVTMLWVAKIGIIEVIEWRNEYYVVTQNSSDKGGMIYKFYGWITYKKFGEAITPSSPTVTTFIPFWYRVWRFFTGQRIINFTVRSANHTFLEGSKVSNQLEWSLVMVRGSKPKEPDGEVGFEGVEDLIKLKVMGGLSDQEFKEASRTLIYKKLYG